MERKAIQRWEQTVYVNSLLAPGNAKPIYLDEITCVSYRDAIISCPTEELWIDGSSFCKRRKRGGG